MFFLKKTYLFEEVDLSSLGTTAEKKTSAQKKMLYRHRP